MSLKLVPFESLGTISYSLFIVTMAVSVAVCEIEWCHLENRVRVRSLRCLMLTVFPKKHVTTFSMIS